MARLVVLVTLAKTAVREAYEHDIKYPAAALAYYAFVSLVPLLLLVLSVVGRSFADLVAARVPRFVTPDAQLLIYEALTAASGRTGAVVLAVGVLAWSAANVAADFLTVVERVESIPAGSRAERLRNGVVVLAGLSTAVLILVLTNVLFSDIAGGAVGAIGEFVVLSIVLTVTFVPVYYAPSNVIHSPTSALPGAVTAAVGWTTIHAAIQIYAENAAAYAIYGVLSGVIIILTGLYLAAVVLMLGIVVNETLATGVGSSGTGDG